MEVQKESTKLESESMEQAVWEPDPSEEEIETYWQQLIDVRTDDYNEALDDEREAIEAEFRSKDEENLRDELTRLDANDPHTRLRRGEMVVRLADYEIAEAIALLRGIPVGTDEERSRLALWLILEMRWPRLAEALRVEPERVGASAAGTVGDEIASLLADPAVQSVVEGELIGANPDAHSVRRLSVL